MSVNTEKPKILVVDDIEINRIILHEILSAEYEIEEASEGMEAINAMLNSIEKPALLLLDIMMPGMDGFQVLEYMKSEPLLSKIPVIFITAAQDEERGLKVGAVDYISKPFESEIVKLRVANHIELSLYRQKLEGMVEQKANELIATKEKFLETMADLIEYRSMESGQHVKRTKDLARILVMQLLRTKKYRDILSNDDPNLLVKAVPLHDIGKISIPDNILLKPGRLDPEEFEVIKGHTTIGGNVIKSLVASEEDEYLRHCYDICMYHHERWDGRGYPEGLSGTDIPLSARIVALIDVYDALISERCYKKAMSHEEASEIIRKSSGEHFDPDMVEAFFQVENLFKNYNVD